MGQDVKLTVEQIVTPSFSSGSFGLAPTGSAGTVQTLVSTNTISFAQNQSVARVTAAAAVTGILLPVGTVNSQIIWVIHEGAAANTITFAAASANNPGGPANGTSSVITGPSARSFIWDSVTGLWYQNT